MSLENRRICVKCIMDESDPTITFDAQGVCCHCHKYDAVIQDKKYLAKREPGALEKLVDEIKRKGRRRRYDCIIGVSGGVDSAYVAYLTKKLGLRALAVHMDNGWNSELAVKNIENIVKKLGIDLYTHVLDWNEFRELQLAFLKASTPDSEIPTDHAILAVLYQAAAREGVEFILSGHNTATESGGVAAWSQGHADWGYIKSVFKRFGTGRLKSFPHLGPQHYFTYGLIKKIKWVPILDYVNYDKEETKILLQQELGWRPYAGKHYESIYTRFFQGYWLPKKFGFDKRRFHLSSLIWSKQLTRDEALKQMTESDYPQEQQQEDLNYVIKKYGLTDAEFKKILELPKKSFWDYPSYKKALQNFPAVIAFYHRLKRA